MTMSFLITLTIIFFIFLFISYFVLLTIIIRKQNRLKRYTQIRLRMSGKQMLNIMGDGYNVSSLKNNRRKYEWRINSTSSSYNGFRSYTGVRKVDIFVKDGYVEEIRPYNVMP